MQVAFLALGQIVVGVFDPIERSIFIKSGPQRESCQLLSLSGWDSASRPWNLTHVSTQGVLVASTLHAREINPLVGTRRNRQMRLFNVVSTT